MYFDYFTSKRLTINKKFENDYEECAKSIAHEYRHVFQIFYVSLFSNERSIRWNKKSYKELLIVQTWIVMVVTT